MSTPLIILPVKDSIKTMERAVRAILDSGHPVCVYDDYSTAENETRLAQLQLELAFELIHLRDLTTHPSPNYRTVLIHARQRALQEQRPLIIIESDVVVKPNTIANLLNQQRAGVGMIAAVTTNESGQVIFPYEYTVHFPKQTIPTKKRLSFCCTLLTTELLQSIDFEQVLDPAKSWFDVTLSHLSLAHHFENVLMMDNPVIHYPHSSRPWKKLKYTHPLLYYIRKLLYGRDKI